MHSVLDIIELTICLLFAVSYKIVSGFVIQATSSSGTVGQTPHCVYFNMTNTIWDISQARQVFIYLPGRKKKSYVVCR